MNVVLDYIPTYQEYLKKEQEKVAIKRKLEKDALKAKFKDKIKISFMFKVLGQIAKETNNYESIRRYYPTHAQYDVDGILNGKENIELDLCKHITGVHTFNMLVTEEHKRGEKQRSQKYINEIVSEVLHQVKIRKYGSIGFRKNPLFGKEDYLYYPPLYNIHALLIDLIIRCDEICRNSMDMISMKNRVLNTLILHILGKSRAILSIFDYNALDSGYPLLRNVIEMYLTYLALKYSSCDTSAYIKFNEYKVLYHKEEKLPKEFENEYYKNAKNANKIAYLNFGWLDSIFEFGYFGIKKSYNISDVVRLVDELVYKHLNAKHYGSHFEKYYKKCHYHSHATLFGPKYDLPIIIDLCKGLGEVLLGISYHITKEYHYKSNLHNSIVTAVQKSLDRLHKLKYELNDKNLEKIYRERQQ